ncbi:MAG: AI-2E family transporter [Oscillospiraceae bacterium]|nr:AI-2E family transporter [Oscillospiraceae bacterium]
MNQKFNKRYFTIALYAFLTVCACILFYLLINNFYIIGVTFRYIGNLTGPLIYAFVIAYAINPILNFWERILKENGKHKLKTQKALRGWSVVLTYLCVIIILSMFVLIIAPNLVTSMSIFISNISIYTKNLSEWIEKTVKVIEDYAIKNPVISTQLDNFENMLSELMGVAVNWLKNIFPDAIDFLAKVSVEVKNLTIGLIVSVYMLIDKEKFIAQLKKLGAALFKEERVAKVVGVMRFTHETIGSYIVGKIADSAIIGVITFFTLAVFGISFPLLLSVIVGITNIIPFFGPFIGAIPCIIILLMIEPVQAFWFAILILIIQQIDGNIIGPKIIGKSTGISAFWVVVAITIGGGLFGFWGMLLGVPVFAVIYSLVKNAVVKKLEKKGLPTETSYYVNYLHKEPKLLMFDSADADGQTEDEGVRAPLTVKIWSSIKKRAVRIWEIIKKILYAFANGAARIWKYLRTAVFGTEKKKRKKK